MADALTPEMTAAAQSGAPVPDGPRTYQTAWLFDDAGRPQLLTAEDWLRQEADVDAALGDDREPGDDAPSRAGVLLAIANEIATLRRDRSQWAEHATRLTAALAHVAALAHDGILDGDGAPSNWRDTLERVSACAEARPGTARLPFTDVVALDGSLPDALRVLGRIAVGGQRLTDDEREVLGWLCTRLQWGRDRAAARGASA